MDGTNVIGTPPTEAAKRSPNLASVINLDAARALLFSEKANRKLEKVLDVEIGDQLLRVKLIAPTYAERRAVYQAAGIGRSRAKGKGQARETEQILDVEFMRVHAVIATAHLICGEEAGAPVSKLFKDTDADLILATYVGGPFDQLADAAMDLINVDEEDLRKNSPKGTAK